MHVALAPGETLLPGTQEALDVLFARADVDAVLLPLVPQGEGALPRAARTHLATWDARFLHRQTFFAPASRAATRAPLPGPLNAHAAPYLADTIGRTRVVEALPAHGVVTGIGRDMGTWVAHFREEGRAWGWLAAREPRFRPFLPALTRAGWWRHNVLQAPRRTGEILQAQRSAAPLPWLLHLAAESAFTGACAEAAAREG